MEVSVHVEPHLGATPEEVLQFAAVAEAEGFHGFYCADHVLSEIPDPTEGPLDAWLLLAALAQTTATLKLGTLVSPVTLRPPSITVLMAAQLDAMSGGRFRLGLGTGWFREEHEAHGIAFPPPAARYARLEQTLRTTHAAWRSVPCDRTDQPRAGPPAHPRPHRDGGPRLTVGGTGSTRTPMLAAQYADEHNVPFPTLALADDLSGHVTAACRQIGRDPRTLRRSVLLTVCCGQDAAQVTRRHRAIERFAPAVDLTRMVCGLPASVTRRLRSFAALGFEHVYLEFLDLRDTDHLRLVARQVVAEL